MYEELVKQIRDLSECFDYEGWVDTAILLSQAADVIEEPSKPCWIPMTDPPKEDGDYLAYVCLDDNEPFIAVLPFDANVPGFGYWEEYYDPVTYGWAGSDFIECKGVTHWMPSPTAPDPPKKEETE